MRRSIILLTATLTFSAAALLAEKELPAMALGNDTQQSCSASLLFQYQDDRHKERIRDVSIWQLPNTPAFFFDAGMTIDADGAPNAYHPENIGIDDLANAGEPGHWDGVVIDGDGNPFIQGSHDPFPGFYVSCTSLADRQKEISNPARYVDATRIPYVVLPHDLASRTGARLGDFAVVMNLRNGKSSYAIFADTGTIGEGSVALAERLGISSDARNGGTGRGIRYIVFPHSGNGKPRSAEEIDNATDQLFQERGGAARIDACAAGN
jgi:hypothetical protein